MAARNAESSRHGKVPLPGPPLILGVWSHKGGTGKSTFAAMVACMLAKKGYKTIMVDADAQQSITFHFAENVINVEEEPEEDEQGEEAEEPAHSAAERDEVGPAAGFALTLPSIRSDRLRNPDTLLAEDFDSMAKWRQGKGDLYSALVARCAVSRGSPAASSIYRPLPVREHLLQAPRPALPLLRAPLAQCCTPAARGAAWTCKARPSRRW